MRERFIHIFITAALLLSLCGCGKENAAGSGSSSSSELIINAAIDNTTLRPETRSAYSGTVFPYNRNLGLCVCVSEAVPPSLFEPHQLGYGNIRVTCTNNSGSAWSYYNSTLNLTLSSLYLTSREDGALVDIYAYTPYMDGVRDIRAIPVDFSKNQDYMWAEQNGVFNRSINPAEGTQIEVPLSFRHTLSRLRLGFKLEYAGSNHLLNYITLRKTGGGTTAIYSSGKFNALNGTYAQLEEAADSVRIGFGGTSGETNGLFSKADGYTYFDFLLYPTDYAADYDLTLSFGIDGFRYEYAVKRSDVRHSDGTTYGFKGGFSYDFQFLLDNYVHLKGISIRSVWEHEEREDVL